jgi:DMSO/TMAO reductase YedYZ molybdopterin-dependent catalytic subunit
MVRHPGPVRRLVSWLTVPLPAPRAAVRRGPLRAGAFPSALRSTRLTSWLGMALAVAFGLCFLTGLLSHLIQHPPAWFDWPPRPVWGYRLTQGIHVASGLAALPLMGVKLWSVYPRLFSWPPLRTPAHAAERAGVAVLVAGSLFQVVGGLFNIYHWYAPMPFFFTAGHYWGAWLTVGALLVHIAVQLPAARAVVGSAGTPVRRAAPAGTGAADTTEATGLTRRGLLAGTAAAAGLTTLTTLGQTVGWLRPFALLAPRRPGTGPQGVPVNRTAAAAGIGAPDSAYRLVVTGGRHELTFDLAGLHALPHHTVELPIACVEGWSATGTWTGVRLRDLIRRAGADPRHTTVVVESLQRSGRYRTSTVPPAHARDPRTLIAVRLNGHPLHPDHGYPARLIAPNRPGVLQTKWVCRLVLREQR